MAGTKRCGKEEDRDPAQARAGGVSWRGEERVCRESHSAIALAFERTSARYKGNGVRRVGPRMNESGQWDSACRVDESRLIGM